MTQGLTTAIQVILAIILCWFGGQVYGVLHAGRKLNRELTLRDNTAFALPYGAFLLGIMLILGASGPGSQTALNLPRSGSLFLWGLLGITLVSVASWIQERFLFPELALWTRVSKNKNISAGIVLAGSHLANALITRGALTDEGGPVVAVVFWIYAELLWVIAMRIFLKFSHYHMGPELKRDNRAVAMAFAGGCVAMGNLLGYSIAGSFLGWSDAFAGTTEYALAALAFLYVVHLLTDWLFFPGVTLHDEIVTQDVPNIGVGYLVLIFYIGLSFVIGGSLS